MISEDCLVTQSRDNRQNSCHKSQKHVLYQIQQENASKNGILYTKKTGER